MNVRALLAGLTALALLVTAPPARAEAPLRLAVMDPLCAQLACACVEGFAQRKYRRLADFIAKKTGRKVVVAYGESLNTFLKQGGVPDLVIGKWSIVRVDAARLKTPLQPIARLTDKQGSTDLVGLFIVRPKDKAKSIADLKGYRLLFGPADSAEKHSAAFAALEENGVPIPKTIVTKSSCSACAHAVLEKEADASVISSYALALLEGCNTIDKGSLRVIGKTRPVPFVTAFVPAATTPAKRKAILDALLAVRTDAALLEAMESKSGFLPIPSPTLAKPAETTWADWRGPNRNGHSPNVPATLPETKQYLWVQRLTGLGLSGVCAAADHVVVADKSKGKTDDIFRCLDADTGTQLWTLQYPAPGEMDYSNSPRAMPLIQEGRVFLLGAFGHLHCLEVDTGRLVWQRHLVADFGAELVQWGHCGTPLLLDGKLIVSPGAKDAAIVALDPATGKLLWKAAGRQPGYASFVAGTFGGAPQIVGYDTNSLGGWDPATGKRLWELFPKEEGDFNVPTPIALNGKLLVSTENNGTRIYGFDARGRILPTPVAENADLAPDTTTPVVIDGKVIGCWEKLYCLDAANGLKTLWEAEDVKAYDNYVSIIAGNGRVLIVTTPGEVLLVRAAGKRYELLSRLTLFAKDAAEVWAFPALVRGRLYLRTQNALYCLLLPT
ncbi:PQQ-binding-like beta-propeller repeat protein [bacterium]|nr:PQQ-binding-like beta-propeller repeat protein [bacterium]